MNRRLALCLGILVASPLRADEIESDPIRYSTAPASNPISRLEDELKGNASLLAEKDSRAFLKALLEHLRVPESSQTLVFSRTSLQRNKIRPDRPRAIYFSDDVYVGACQNSNLFEFSAVDPNFASNSSCVQSTRIGVIDTKPSRTACTSAPGCSSFMTVDPPCQ